MIRVMNTLLDMASVCMDTRSVVDFLRRACVLRSTSWCDVCMREMREIRDNKKQTSLYGAAQDAEERSLSDRVQN